MAAILDKIEQYSVKQQALVVLAIVVVLVLLFWQFPYKKKTAIIKRAQVDLSAVNSELADLRAIQKKLEEFKSMIVELEAQLVEAQRQLPRQREIPKLLNDISEFGKETGMEFVSFRPANEMAKGFYAEVPINLVISGPFHNLTTFLDKITHYPRIIKVTSLDLSVSRVARKDDEEGGPVMLRATCQATTYRYLEEK